MSEYKPPLFWRIVWRLQWGKDQRCDLCGRRTYWNGNVLPGYEDKAEQPVICDYCQAGWQRNE